MFRRFGYIFCAVLFIWSCQSNPMDSYKPLNLIQYGVPLTILAPDSSQVEKTKLSFQDDITIKSGDDYDVQLFVSEALNSNFDIVLEEQKNVVKIHPFFSKFIQEDPKGFIFEMKIDSSTTSYGFRHIDLMGDKEYIFQEALIGTFSLEAAENMYNGVTSEH